MGRLADVAGLARPSTRVTPSSGNGIVIAVATRFGWEDMFPASALPPLPRVVIIGGTPLMIPRSNRSHSGPRDFIRTNEPFSPLLGFGRPCLGAGRHRMPREGFSFPSCSAAG